MSTQVTLERFDAEKEAADRRPLRTLADVPPPVPDLAVETDQEPLEPVPIVRPVDPGPSAEDLVAQDLAQKADRIAALLQNLPAELSAARARAAEQMCQSISQAASVLLPSLIDQGMADEISAATLQIALAMQPDQIQLALHPDDHELVVDALCKLSPPEPVVVTKDASLARAEARLTWPEGGARIDSAALVQQATEILQIKLATLTTKESSDDQ